MKEKKLKTHDLYHQTIIKITILKKTFKIAYYHHNNLMIITLDYKQEVLLIANLKVYIIVNILIKTKNQYHLETKIFFKYKL